MNLNSAITTLIEAALTAQKQGVYSVYESREIANAIDTIERTSKEQEEAIRKAHQEANERQQKDQQAVPPVAPQ